jgi:hypothetical protein
VLRCTAVAVLAAAARMHVGCAHHRSESQTASMCYIAAKVVAAYLQDLVLVHTAVSLCQEAF